MPLYDMKKPIEVVLDAEKIHNLDKNFKKFS
jgi:hypothetical protein